jgi:hypothetical protein
MKFSKYPRTPHLPWSPGAKNDDIHLKESPFQEGEEVVITEKMDGENTSLYQTGLHARSLDSRHHPARTWIKKLWAEKCHLIPENYKICGENLQAKHSIPYNNLPSYFLVFSLWKDEECLSWEETETFCQKLELHTVPILYKGPYHNKTLKPLFADENWTEKEGYVIRTAHAFYQNQFSGRIAKYVRQNHVQTNQHWMHQKITPNQLKTKA